METIYLIVVGIVCFSLGFFVHTAFFNSTVGESFSPEPPAKRPNVPPPVLPISFNHGIFLEPRGSHDTDPFMDNVAGYHPKKND